MQSKTFSGANGNYESAKKDMVLQIGIPANGYLQ